MLKKVKLINDEVSFQNQYPEFNSNWDANFARKKVVRSLYPGTDFPMEEKEEFFDNNNVKRQTKITEWYYKKDDE